MRVPGDDGVRMIEEQSSTTVRMSVPIICVRSGLALQELEVDGVMRLRAGGVVLDKEGREERPGRALPGTRGLKFLVRMVEIVVGILGEDGVIEGAIETSASTRPPAAGEPVSGQGEAESPEDEDEPAPQGRPAVPQHFRLLSAQIRHQGIHIQSPKQPPMSRQCLPLTHRVHPQ